MSVNVASCHVQWLKLQDVFLKMGAASMKFIVCMLGLSLLYTLNDAHETERLSFYHSFVLWIVVFGLTAIQFLLIKEWLVSLKPLRKFYRPLNIGASILLTNALMTIELHFLKFTPLLPKQPDPIIDFYLFLLPSVSIWCFFLVLLDIPIKITETNRINGNVTSADPNDSRLKSILLENKILHIAASDHYLDIICENGRQVIRGKMNDAVYLLQDLDGQRVHRSHWVVKSAIVKAIRKGRDLKLILSTGEEVPVSRLKVSALKSWLRPTVD